MFVKRPGHGVSGRALARPGSQTAPPVLTGALAIVIVAIMAVSGISTMGITRLAALAGSPSTIQASVTTSATRNATLSIGTGLTNTWGIALDTKSGYLFVSDGGGQDVAAINGATNTLVSDIKVENGSIDPTGIAYDPVNDNVYVADQGGGDVTVIGGSNLTVWKHIGIGTAPTLAWGAFFDPAANEVFVSYNANHKLTVIDCTSNAVVGNFTSGNGNSPTGGSAFGWAYDPYSQQIFQGGHPVELLAINAAKPWNATNISVYGTPTGVAYDSKNGNVYLSTYPVGIINGTNDTVFGSLSNATTGWGGTAAAWPTIRPTTNCTWRPGPPFSTTMPPRELPAGTLRRPAISSSTTRRTRTSTSPPTERALPPSSPGRRLSRML